MNTDQTNYCRVCGKPGVVGCCDDCTRQITLNQPPTKTFYTSPDRGPDLARKLYDEFQDRVGESMWGGTNATAQPNAFNLETLTDLLAGFEPPPRRYWVEAPETITGIFFQFELPAGWEWHPDKITFLPNSLICSPRLKRVILSMDEFRSTANKSSVWGSPETIAGIGLFTEPDEERRRLIEKLTNIVTPVITSFHPF